MPIPSVVVFDLGKVLLDFDYRIAAQRIAARGVVATHAVQKFLDQSPLLHRFETGLMTKEQFFDEVRNSTGFAGGFNEFNNFFADIFLPIEPMVELHAAVRQRGMPTYIFSNTNDLAIGHIRRNFPFYANFDGYIYSYEHGAMKPNAALYEVLERQANCHNAEIFYLDDRAENVAAGAARGWQVLLHETPGKTRAAFRKLGLLNCC